MNLHKALGSVGGLTLASRVLGLVRDSLFFRFVGANFASDAFQIAFRLPNMFRALFAEGAFSAAFIPMFNRKVAEGDQAAEGSGLQHGLAFAENALSVLLPVLIVMTALVELAAWPVTWVQTFGYGKGTAAQFDYIVLLNRLTFPYLLFISLVSLLGGILNSLHRFWVNAAAPILLNLTLIVALLLFHEHDPLPTARNQAIAVSVAGLLQLAWLWWACRRAGVRLRIKRPTINDDVKRLMKLILPAAAGAGEQIGGGDGLHRHVAERRDAERADAQPVGGGRIDAEVRDEEVERQQQRRGRDWREHRLLQSDVGRTAVTDGLGGRAELHCERGKQHEEGEVCPGFIVQRDELQWQH